MNAASVKHHIALAGVVVALLAAGCSGAQEADPDPGGEQAATSSTSPSPSASSSASSASPEGLRKVRLPIRPGADVDGLVRVDGHQLAVHCRGSGHPTSVILHGWIDEPGVSSYGFYGGVMAALQPDFRVCSYDRANVGDSEAVQGTQTPEMVVGDLDGLMEAMGDRGPYVLIGQSAGGMVASAYAVAHPDKVAGIVMVDATFDEEVTLEDVGRVPEGFSPCDPSNRRIDGRESLQKIDNCVMYKWAYARRDRRPEVPLAYLAAKQAPWSAATELGPAYTSAIVPLQKSYAASWSPGKFQWVDSGHEIHIEKPGVVAEAVRWVVKEGSP